MKPIFAYARWLYVPLVFSLLAATALAQQQTVRVTVNVLSGRNQPVPGANVTLTLVPDSGTPPVHMATGDDGSATGDIQIGAPKFGEGWLRTEPTIKITAEKESDTGSTVVNVRTKSFNAGAVVEIARTVTLSPPPAPLTATSTTRLTVIVVDENGKLVGGASVSLSRDRWGPDSVVYDNRMETGSDGVASMAIQIKGGGGFNFGEGWLYSPTFDVEVRKDDLSGKDRVQIVGGSTPKGFRYPEYIARSVVVRNFEHGQEKQKATINVTVAVEDDKHNVVEGARVLIMDPYLGAGSGRFSGVTGPDGRITIPVWWTSASSEQNFGLDVSRTGYRDKKTIIALNNKQVGTTVSGGTISLEKTKSGEEGVTVNVKVLNKKNGRGVVNAKVVLDGGGGAYYSDETNGEADVAFNVTEAGTFAVRISHSVILPFSGEIRLLPEDKGKQRNFTFEVEGKDKADQGQDTLEVTVLGKESDDANAKTVPVVGAEVRAGSISGPTGSDGVALLTGAFEEDQYVTVRADNYKTQTKKLRLKKGVSILTDNWKTRIVLDPELTDQIAIRLLIEVRDKKDTAVPKATVALEMMSGDFVAKGPADEKGNFQFNSAESEHDLALLRQGIKVTVQRRGYAEYQSTIDAELLKPSTATRKYHVQLDSNWDEVRKALDALEPRVLAWNNDLATLTKLLESIKKSEAEITKSGQRAAKDSDEFDRLLKAMAEGKEKTAAQTRCEEVEQLKKNITDYAWQATNKEDELKKMMDEAKTMAATCKTANDADQIKKLYDKAVELTGKIGVLEKKAVKDGNALNELVKEPAEKDAFGSLDNKLSDLVLDATQADGLAKAAGQALLQAQKLNESVKSNYAALTGELANLKKTFGLDTGGEAIPEDLLKRVATMEQLLSKRSGHVFPSPDLDLIKRVEEVANNAKDRRDKAEHRLASLKQERKNKCPMNSMDGTVEAIGAIVTSCTIELAAAADLLKQADACLARAKSATDEVDVPDVSQAGDDPDAMLAAAAPLVGALVATDEKPPDGSKKLFSHQNPLPNTKSQRGKPLQIFLYQQLAEKPSPSPSPDSDEITVPDISKFSDPDAMLAGAAPDMVGMLVAVRATPPPGTTTLFSHQEPPANTKSKRGKPLMIYVYQALAEPSPAPTETPEATPAPSAAIAEQTAPEETPPPEDNGSNAAQPAAVGETASDTEWVGTWGAPGSTKDAFTISRGPDGYVLVGPLTDNKPVSGGVVNGDEISFHWELDLRDVVGIIGQTEKSGKKEDNVIQSTIRFVRREDGLDLDFVITGPGSPPNRGNIPGLKRIR